MPAWSLPAGASPSDDNFYWRIAQFLMPIHAYAPSAMPGENMFGQSFVPVTDTSCWIYTYAWNPERPIKPGASALYRGGNGVIAEVDENYVPLRNKANDYLIDRQLQKTPELHRHQGRVGAGRRGAGQPGPIADRTREHLGATDLGILRFRKLVMDAARDLQGGKEPDAPQCADRYAVRAGASRHPQAQGPRQRHGRALRRSAGLRRPPARRRRQVTLAASPFVARIAQLWPRSHLIYVTTHN